MQTQKIVYEFLYGGYSNSPRKARCVLADFKGNFDDMLLDVSYNYDTAPGQGTDITRFIIREKQMPNWMTAQFYIEHEDVADEIMSRAPQRGDDLTEAIYMKLAKLRKNVGSENFYAIIKIMEQKTFRSEFRKSIRAQIDTWMENPSPMYDSPLSPRQIQCIRREFNH